MLYRLQLLLSPELLPPSKLLINSLTVCFFLSLKEHTRRIKLALILFAVSSIVCTRQCGNRFPLRYVFSALMSLICQQEKPFAFFSFPSSFQTISWGYCFILWHKSFVKCVDWFYHSLTLVLRLPLSALRGDSPVLFREPREHVSEKLMCSRVLATYSSFPVSLMCFCFTLILCKKKASLKGWMLSSSVSHFSLKVLHGLRGFHTWD